MKPEELIKTLKLEKDCAYLIFVSRETGLSKYDLAKINLKKEFGIKGYYFVLVDGNVAELVKPIELKNYTRIKDDNNI